MKKNPFGFNECRLSFELEESETAPRSVIRSSLEPHETTKYMRQTSVIKSNVKVNYKRREDSLQKLLRFEKNTIVCYKT